MPTVSMPDGTLVDIPDDVSEDQLNQLRQIAQPQQAPPAASPEIPIPEIKSSGYVGRGEFAPEAGAQSAPIVTEQAQDPLAQVAKGVFGAVGSMVPKSLSDVMQMITLPRPSEFESKDLPASEQLGEAWRGEHGLEEQAKAITGTALQAAPLIHLPFAESPLRATPKDLSLVKAFRNLREQPESLVPLSDAATKEAEQIQPKVDEQLPDLTAVNRELAPVTEPPEAIAEPFPSITRSAEDQRRIEQQQESPKVREAISLDELRLMRERNELQLQNDIAKRATGGTHPVVDERLGQIDEELTTIANRELQREGSPPVEVSPGSSIVAKAPERTVSPMTPALGGAATEPKVTSPRLLPGETQGDLISSTQEVEPVPAKASVQEPLSITSIKNAQVDTERAARGLPEVVEPARKSFGESWDQATQKIDQNPAYPDQLIEELKNKPRALNDVEDAALLHRQVDIQNQYQKAADSLVKASESGDETARMESDATVNALSDQLLELYDVGKKAGTETGRGLAARKLLVAEDFSLANMITQKRAANQGAALTPEQAAEVNTASKQISARQTALDAYETSSKAEAYRNRLKGIAEQYRTKTAKGDFTTRQPSKIPLDKDHEALKADLERAKKDWLTALQKDRAANRTSSQKFWDRFVGVERAMKLSSDVVLAKLSAAAVVREAGLTPLEEVAGGGIGKVLPGLAKRAPREGGFSLDAEIKAKSEMFTSGMKDAWQNLKMKQSDLDTLYSGRKPGPPTEFYDYLGYLHGALKAPIKRAEFARSLTKRMRWAVENGQDLNNVNTMRALSEEAYVDANRSIFMQDNVVASTFTGALRMAEMSKKAPNMGPAIARIGRFLVPIVKIPTNIVGEVATGIHGVATGGSRAAVAYLKGIDTLPPVQADSIMRQLKKGLIGNALILTGYYTAENIGGFYHDKDKRTPEDVQPGRYRIGNVDIPASAGHSTGAMLLNIGATVKRVENERLRKGEQATKGLGEGVRAAGAGLAHEIPFVPAATGITDALGSPNGFQKYINGMIQSTTVPALSSHIAKILDTPGSLPSNILQEPVKRKPTNPLEAVKMGIPGLRQTVPERSERKLSKVKVRP